MPVDYCYTSSYRQPSTGVNVTVGRDYLTEREVERLMKAAGDNRYGHRNATAILVAYRHGLRASELVALRWDDIELQTGRMHVRRAKGGAPGRASDQRQGKPGAASIAAGGAGIALRLCL